MADADDLTTLSPDELSVRLAQIKDQMAPHEAALASLRADRDLLLTEQRRRERLTRRQTRADLRAAMKDGVLPSIAELVASTDSGSFDDYTFTLKTGGEVRLGFPGARSQSIAFTDGRATEQAKDLADAARLFAAGWDLGTPGRPGVRVHLAGTRQERLAGADEVYARLMAR